MNTKPNLDSNNASIARVYDAMLGGKDNFAVDRAVRREIEQVAPQLPQAAHDGRGFLARVTEYLTRHQGIAQFLDLGSGLPTVENTHEVAQRANPHARVVYVDNDPAVHAFERAFLADDATAFVDADLADPEAVLRTPEVSRALDWSEPVALYQIGTLHHVHDNRDPVAIMRRWIDAVPSGSFVALSHFYNPRDGSDLARIAEPIEDICAASTMASGFFRTREQILQFMEGLELLPSGPGHPADVVPVADWWPHGPHVAPLSLERQVYVGILGRKP